MDEIGEKLDALLNDPKQFGKIAQLASSILGDGGGKCGIGHCGRSLSGRSNP